MGILSRLFGGTDAVAPAAEITDAQKAQIERLLENLGNEYGSEGRSRASEELSSLANFGSLDVTSGLSAAAKKAAMQWEVKRGTIAMMHGVRPEQIQVQPHVDDSRVAVAAAQALRKLAKRRDGVGKTSKAALEDLRSSIKNAELRSRL